MKILEKEKKDNYMLYVNKDSTNPNYEAHRISLSADLLDSIELPNKILIYKHIVKRFTFIIKRFTICSRLGNKPAEQKEFNNEHSNRKQRFRKLHFNRSSC